MEQRKKYEAFYFHPTDHLTPEQRELVELQMQEIQAKWKLPF